MIKRLREHSEMIIDTLVTDDENDSRQKMLESLQRNCASWNINSLASLKLNDQLIIWSEYDASCAPWSLHKLLFEFLSESELINCQKCDVIQLINFNNRKRERERERECVWVCVCVCVLVVG